MFLHPTRAPPPTRLDNMKPRGDPIERGRERIAALRGRTPASRHGSIRAHGGSMTSLTVTSVAVTKLQEKRGGG